MTQVNSQCMYCRWFKRDRSGTCDAFPGGISDEILLNEVDHRKPVEGDNGVRWELAPDAPPDSTHPLQQ